jgi:hypothetical protein
MSMPRPPPLSALRRLIQPRPWKWDAWLAATCIAVAGLASIRMGQDVNWDLQNYHFYDPWAWLNGRIYTTDIVAAQLQTYHNPLPDIPFYLMVKAGWRPRTIAFMLAVPAGIAAFFLLKLVPLLFRDLPLRERRLASPVAVVIGLTSAMAAGVLGTTMNEWPGTALTIAALWVIVRALADGPREPLARRVLLVAGLLCGLATGAKLTFGIFAVGLCVAILLRRPWRRAFGEAFAFGLAVLAGTAITAGPWMWTLWTHFANPVFPYANELFKSPWWGQYEVMGRPYGPHTLAEWLAFPFTLTAPREFYVTEVEYVDARLPALYGVALLAGAAWLVQRVSARMGGRGDVHADGSASTVSRQVIGIFWVVSFVIWTEKFSIYRYIVPLELLSGALLVAMLRYLLRPAIAGTVIVVVAVALVASTTSPDWWRIDFGRKWFDVKVPWVAPNSLVLLTSDAPMAYVLPFFPADARHFGLNNSINDPKRETLMEEEIVRSIREHRGPIYSLSYPAGTGDSTLAAHGLVRIKETCAEVTTNMRTSPLELCRAVAFPPRADAR